MSKAEEMLVEESEVEIIETDDESKATEEDKAALFVLKEIKKEKESMEDGLKRLGYSGVNDLKNVVVSALTNNFPEVRDPEDAGFIEVVEREVRNKM